VFGVLAVTNAMLPLMGKAPAPRIVTVSSTTASLTYNAGPDAKFAGAPNNLALELATLPDDGPSGGFFNDDGQLPW
jgi:NAD(P)-dependent dehydrogenase (short-subunit alcohol dehydrogenase family)